MQLERAPGKREEKGERGNIKKGGKKLKGKKLRAPGKKYVQKAEIKRKKGASGVQPSNQ